MKNIQNFKGIFPALLTPFNENDKINEKALEQLVRLNIEKGVSGFYVGGSTSEAFLMSIDERKYILDLVESMVDTETALIAHVGCISTSHTIELAKHAAELGYDAISAIPPFYYKFSLNEIKQHYFSIADNVDMPIIVYNFPGFSGVTLSVADLSEFFADNRFIGFKHTSSDFYTMEQTKSVFPDKLIYNGFDEMFLAGLSMGADGGIGSTYNFMAEKFLKMYKLFNESNITKAQKIQKEINVIIKILCEVGVMQAEKELLNIMGLDFGKCRQPYATLTNDQKKYLKATVMPLL